MQDANRGKRVQRRDEMKNDLAVLIKVGSMGRGYL